ncbi:co-chaperone HscB [Vibrio palustris]|uniref:Co-chaperone protein HscB homolog n=1 Tax=Vibrio palustris TaxID=1918946 RepID=A0A1R4B8A3_9VIBR|nr:co-chaperone HscB [Vibrio palustris]SJL85158.1 hypothetical protein VPAL9027_03182 [Vibrio palustris]
MNYFELFGLPTQFTLDGSLLASQFRELQKRFHPDNFASGSEGERLSSVQKASQINDAYRVLKAPISRAEYLVSLHGIELRGEQQTLQDPMFLMEQMELREELENIASSSDPDSALMTFDSKVSSLMKTHLTQVEQQLDNEEWESAAETTRKLKFIAKLKDEIEKVEDKLLG